MTAVPSSPGDDPQTAMLLTETEWTDLAHLCQRYLHDTNWITASFPRGRRDEVASIYRRRDTAERIIRAATDP